MYDFCYSIVSIKDERTCQKIMTAGINLSWSVLISIIVPNIGGWAGAIAVTNNLEWYASLNRAPWNPPTWVFAPMWTLLYSLMGIAAYIVCRATEGKKVEATVPMTLYAVQLLLNWAWTPLFFQLHLLLWSLVEIAVELGLVVLTTVAFFKVKPIAGVLLIPLIAWLCAATSLSAYIYLNNEEPASSDL